MPRHGVDETNTSVSQGAKANVVKKWRSSNDIFFDFDDVDSWEMGSY